MGNQTTRAPQKDNHEPAGYEKNSSQEKTPARVYYPRHGLSVPSPSSPADIPLTRNNLLFLQRAVGNHEVVRLLQRKLKVGCPGDAYEREADRVAEQVVEMPAPSLSRKTASATQESAVEIGRVGTSHGSEMRRQASVEEENRKRPEAEATIQAKEESGQTPEMSPKVESQINSLQGGGEPLAESVRSDFEPRFGVDFSGVRVHKGSQAAETARAINARAYTSGRDIAFGAGEYAPETKEGKRLLAHELTHVVQQKSAQEAMSPKIQRADGDNPSNLQKLDEMLNKINVPEEEVIALLGKLNAAEKAGVLAGGYQARIAGALNVGEMVRAVNNLNPELQVKLGWVKAAATVTSQIDYSDIKGMVSAAPQPEKDALKNAAWQSFFVDVCTNKTMVDAVTDLGFDLATKLNWIRAEMTWVRVELSYSDIKQLITAASKPDKDALKDDSWRAFFVQVCTNETMSEAVDDLGWDLKTKLEWMNEEGASWTLLRAKIVATSDVAQKTALYDSAGMQEFFVSVCNNEEMADAVNLLGGTLTQKLKWMLAEGTSAELVYKVIQASTPVERLAVLKDTAILESLRAALSGDEYKTAQDMLIVQGTMNTQTDTGNKYESWVKHTGGEITISKEVNFIEQGTFAAGKFDALKTRLATAVTSYLSRKFKVKIEPGPGGQPSPVDGEYPIIVQVVDKSGASYPMNMHGGQHGRSAVSESGGDIYELGLPEETSVPDIGLAHESAHMILGASDEYASATVPARVLYTDNSLMGNFYTEGIAAASIKARSFHHLVTHISTYLPDRKISIVP